jgi:hypothetical protein
MSIPTEKRPLKKARKVLKFWYKVLLASELMNDKKDRIEFAEALKTIKQHSK